MGRARRGETGLIPTCPILMKRLETGYTTSVYVQMLRSQVLIHDSFAATLIAIATLER